MVGSKRTGKLEHQVSRKPHSAGQFTSALQPGDRAVDAVSLRSLKSQETESSTLSPLSLLLGDDPGHPSQRLQATSSQDQEPLGSEYQSLLSTYGQPQALEEPEVLPGHKAGWGSREGLFLDESAPPSGFFPYYRSQEEHLPNAAQQGCWRLGSRDPFPGSAAQDDYYQVTSQGWMHPLKRPQEGGQHEASAVLQTTYPWPYPQRVVPLGGP